MQTRTKRIVGGFLGVLMLAGVVWGVALVKGTKAKTEAKYAERPPAEPMDTRSSEPKPAEAKKEAVTGKSESGGQSTETAQAPAEAVKEEGSGHVSVPEVAEMPPEDGPVIATAKPPGSLEDHTGKKAAIDLPSDERAETLLVSPGETAYNIYKSLDKYGTVESPFMPVQLYQVYGNIKTYIGSGTLYGDRIYAPEHVLQKSMGHQFLGYLSLRPFTNRLADNGIERVEAIGSMFPGTSSDASSNIVVLKVGTPTLIECKSERTFPSKERLGYVKHPDGPTMQHLVSGQEVRTVGLAINQSDNAPYLIIEYEPILGESGSGFVDKDGKLYMLIGQFVSEEDPKAVEERLGTSKPLAIVTEGLNFKK